MGTQDGSAITRRGFLAGAATLLGGLYLPQVAGAEGTYVIPVYPEAQIMVVGRTEIGIAVVDTSQDPLLPIEGAKVKIYSHYNRYSISGTSDETGKITLDISELAEEQSPDSPAQEGSKKEEYCLNGEITITREGYRDVVIPCTRIRSVSALIAPTRPLEENKPYFRVLSFDDWDIQYTKATFLQDESNTGMHRFAAQVWIPDDKPCDLRLYWTLTDEETGESSVETIGEKTLQADSSEGGFTGATFEEAFLNTLFEEKVLPAGCIVHAELTYDGVVYDQITGLGVKQPPIAECTDGEVSLAPGTYYDDSLSIFKLPSSLPKPLGGSSFSIWKPVFDNIGFDFSPAGYLMIGLTIGSMSALNKNGSALDRDAWKEWPDETAGDQYNRVTGLMEKKLNKVGDMYSNMGKDGNSSLFSHSYSSMITATGSFQIFANLDYSWKDKIWGGSLNAVVGANVDGKWTIQMIIVTVPIFISFDACAEIDAGMRFAMQTYGKSLNELFDNMTYDADDSTVAITTTIEIGLSLGVGVAGVLSVYVRGSGYITMNVAFYQGNPDAKSPRLTVGVGLEAKVGVQLLLFKWSGPIWSEDWPSVYDSANPAKSAMSLGAKSLPNMKDIADEMEIITNDELLGVAEFEASASAVSVMSTMSTNHTADPVDLGNGCMQWEMPSIGNAARGISMFANQEDADYLGKSSTGKDPQSNIGVAGLGRGILGGVRPTADTVVFKNVFADDKVKVIRFNNADVMLRIASVNYNGEARTRLTYSIIRDDGAWSDPAVIDFDPSSAGVTRAELYDYDFDATCVGAWSNYLYVMIISGTRTQGDKTSFASATSKTYISLVRIYNSNTDKDPLKASSALTWQVSNLSSSSRTKATFSMPRITGYSDDLSFDRETNSCLIGTCLVRTSSKEADLAAGKGRAYLLSFFAEHRRDEAPVVVTNKTRVAPDQVSNIVMGPIAFADEPQSCIRANERYVNVGVTAANGNDIYSGVWAIKVDYDDQKQAFTLTHEQRVHPADNFEVMRLYPSGKDGEFYAIKAQGDAPSQSGEFQRDGRLYLASFDAQREGGFSFEPVGPSDFAPSELAVSRDGAYLFYAVNKEGASGQKPKSDGTLGDTVSSNEYRIMGMARVGGLFTKPFVLCELDHPVDHVVAMTSANAAATLIATHITNAKMSRADIHDIRIPLVVCATPLSIATVGPFAFAGEDTEFNVAVRNDGNTIITGATFDLCDGSGNVVDSVAMSFDAAALANVEEDSSEKPVYDVDELSAQRAASPLASAGKGEILAPGKTETYRVTFKIPASWKHERSVRIKIDNSTVSVLEPTATMSAMSKDGDSQATIDEELGDWYAGLFENRYDSFQLKRKKLPSTDITIVKSQRFSDSKLVAADRLERAVNSNKAVSKK